MYRWFRWYFNFLFWFSFISTIGCWCWDQFINNVQSIYRFLGKKSWFLLSVHEGGLFWTSERDVSKSKMNHIRQNCRFAPCCGIQGVPITHEPFPFDRHHSKVRVPFMAMYGSDSAFSIFLLASSVNPGVFYCTWLKLWQKTGAHYRMNICKSGQKSVTALRFVCCCCFLS